MNNSIANHIPTGLSVEVMNKDHVIVRSNDWFMFFSYNKLITLILYDPRGHKTYLDEKYWNYSNTTNRYRCKAMGESGKETIQKINHGEYQFTDLN